MAKGKKTTIKEIKRLENDEIEINGRVYIIIEDIKDIESAKYMKISSHGNRLLRFDDLKKKAVIDVKREIDIIKYTIPDTFRAKRFKDNFDKNILTKQDKTEFIAKVSSHKKAREFISNLTSRDSEDYDKHSGTTTFYQEKEVK